MMRLKMLVTYGMVVQCVCISTADHVHLDDFQACDSILIRIHRSFEDDNDLVVLGMYLFCCQMLMWKKKTKINLFKIHEIMK